MKKKMFKIINVSLISFLMMTTICVRPIKADDSIDTGGEQVSEVEESPDNDITNENDSEDNAESEASDEIEINTDDISDQEDDEDISLDNDDIENSDEELNGFNSGNKDDDEIVDFEESYHNLNYEEPDIDTSDFIVNRDMISSPNSNIDNITSFDLRSVGGNNYVTPVKNQSSYGVCWSYATMASAESTYLKKHGTALDLSEVHLAYFAYHNYGIADPLNLIIYDGIIHNGNLFDEGGNTLTSTSTFSSGAGIVDDSTMSTANLLDGTEYTETTFTDKLIRNYGSNYQNYCYGRNSYYLVDSYMFDITDTATLKEAIYNYGAITATYFEDDAFYNRSNYAFYNDSVESTNHAVTIVGWDDNFSKYKFNDTPNNNGAWLIKNSWGTDSRNNGYFWISYEDVGLLSSSSAFQFFIEPVSADSLIYQYDGSRYSRYYYGQTVKAGNVFTSIRNEKITKVGYYTSNANVITKISIYVDVNNNPDSGTLVKTYTVSDLYAGYHTFDITDDIYVSNGQKYSIVIEQESTVGDDVKLYVTTECLSGNANLKDQTSSGQSFKGYVGYSIWNDLSASNETACIKAHTSPANITKVSSIALDKTSISLTAGQSETITATVSPDNATNKVLNWSSDKNSVATVDSNGVVTAVGAGTALIKAEASDGSGVSATCTVNVSVSATSITLNKSAITVTKGSTYTLRATVYPTNASDKTVTWTSSNPDVATVNNGVVTAVGNSTVKTATITATTSNGQFATCQVTVSVPATGITLSESTKALNKGNSFTLTAVVSPSNADDKTINWSSSNTDVATVNNGVVTAVGNGSANIYAKTSNGYSATCRVTVTTAVVGVSLNHSSYSLYKNGTVQLVAYVDPQNASNREVTWSSSESSIARVSSNGLVTAVSAGSAVISVTTSDGGYTATCDITVKQYVESINFVNSSYSLAAGETHQLNPTVLPANADNKTLSWSSSNTNVARVNTSGLVTAVNYGTATITARSTDGSNVSATCTINVFVPVSSVTIDDWQRTLYVGDKWQINATVSPDNATNKTLSWESGNEDIASVDQNGMVTCLAKGTASIYATSTDGSNKSDYAEVTVRQQVTSLQLNESVFNLYPGESSSFIVSVEPVDADNKDYSCSSSDENVAIIRNGSIYAVGPGTATITFNAADRGVVTNSVVVNVYQPVTDLSITNGNQTIYQGHTLQLLASVLPEDAHDKTLFWSSSDESVASVDQNGLITAIKAGTVIISAATTDGSNLEAECTVTVEELTSTSGNAYAVLTDAGDLIFFRSFDTYADKSAGTFKDIFNNSYTGTVFTGFENLSSFADPSWQSDAYRLKIKNAYVADNTTISPASMYGWFLNCKNLTSFDHSGIDTSNVINTSLLFSGCSSLTSFDSTGFDTSEVTTMRYMFYGCSSLTSLDLSNFNTSNVIDMSGMFEGCSSLESLDLSSFNTSNVENMTWMFDRCSSLLSVKLGPDFTNWINDAYLPSGIWENEDKGLSKNHLELYNDYKNYASAWQGTWIIENESGYAYAVLNENGDFVFFRSTYTYTDQTTGTFTDIHNNSYTGTVFTGFEYLSSFADPTWQSDTYTSNIKKIYVADNTTISPTSMYGWFLNCNNLTSFDHSGFDTTNVTNMSLLFSGCSSLTSLSISKFNTSDVTTMRYMFYGCSSLTSLDLSNLNTSNVIDMSGMFEGCSSLESLNLSSFNTSNVENMSWMFDRCTSLLSVKLGPDFTNWVNNAYLPEGTWVNEDKGLSKSEIDLYNDYPYNASAWQGIWSRKGHAYAVLKGNGDLVFFRSTDTYTDQTTGSFTDIHNNTYTGTVFSGIEDLTGEQEPSWQSNTYKSDIKKAYVAENTTISPTSMKLWFYGCYNLTSFNSTGFDTSDVTDMSSLFYDCASLTSLDLSYFNTSNVTDMTGMFYGCSSLTTLDLSNFNTSNVIDMSGMFNGCLSLTSLDISRFDTSNVIDMSWMLKDCSLLSSVKLGPNFTNWISDAYLPEGIWINDDIGLFKSEIELYEDYPSNASAWKGAWRRKTNNDNSYAVLTDDGDLVFFRSYYTYEDQLTGTFIDIYDNSYTGTLFSGIEDLSDFEEPTWQTEDYKSDIINVYVADNTTISPETMHMWFTGCENLTSFNSTGFDTSDVIDMIGMFAGCSSLTLLDLSNFDTSNVTYMTSMFFDCNNLETVVLGPKWTNWRNNAYLPNGTWTNGVEYLSNIELYDTYTVKKAGTWTKTDKSYGDIDPEDYDTYDRLNPTGMWTNDITDETYTGSAIKKTLRVYDKKVMLKEGIDYTIKYSNNTKAGSATITIQGKGNHKDTLIKTFNINPQTIDDTNTVITINKDLFKYNGKIQKPSITAVVFDDNRKLKANTDYTIQWSDTEYESATIHSFKIVGKGNYQGEIIKSYEITNKTPVDTLTITLEYTKVAYDGTPKEPKVTIKQGKTDLDESMFKIEYKDNDKAGEASVIVEAKSDETYIGSATKKFTITGTAISKAKIEGFEAKKHYTGYPVQQEVTLTYNKAILNQGVDYNIHYENNVEKGTATMYIDGMGGYTGSIKKTFMITGIAFNSKTIEVSDDFASSVTYSGSPIEQNASIKYTGERLIKGTEYVVSYKNNINVGTATVTYTGINEFEGSFNKTFKITKAKINDTDVTLTNSNYPYTKGGAKPIPEVIVNGNNLVLNKDYSIAYKNNTKSGTASLTVTGKGNYEGKVSKDFTVETHYTNGLKMTANDKLSSNKAYNMSTVITITDESNNKLSSGTDYDKNIVYTYINNTKVTDTSIKPAQIVYRKPGDVVEKTDIIPANTDIRATVTLKGNYSGYISSRFRIVASDISKTNIKIATQYYTGAPIYLDKSDFITNLEDDDFEIVSYSNNINKGSASVTIKGLGEYGGVKTIKFTIAQHSFGVIIRFNGNGATSGTMNDVLITKNTNLPNNSFKKVDPVTKQVYNFQKWTTGADGSGDSYGNKALYEYDEELAGTIVTLYAIWE